MIQVLRDSSVEKEVLEQIRANGGYCPCALVKDDDTKCMCKDFRDKIGSDYVGKCHCGLYEIRRTK